MLGAYNLFYVVYYIKVFLRDMSVIGLFFFLYYCNIQSHHITQIDGIKVETVTDFIFLGSKITADGDCSHEIKRHLLLGKKPWQT